MPSRDRATVRVPATTGNLGPGFDCLGIALDLWNEVTVERSPFSVEIEGEGAGTLPAGPENLVVKGVEAAFNAAGRPLTGLGYRCRNEIPAARGLGSSSAAIVGGLVAGAALCGDDIPIDRLLEMAAEIEGHPDNAAPALFGGCRIGYRADGGWRSAGVPLPEGLHAVLFIPDQQGTTQEARAVLSGSVTRADAVFNISRAALLVHAFSSGNLDLLRQATQDRLHQPARSALFPATNLLISAALDAGAHGAFLSGAGPSVLALATGREITVQYEMREAARLKGVAGRAMVLGLTDRGAHLVEAE